MNECEHEWTEGPFFIKAAVTYEEPRYYPPHGLYRIEHCKLCGFLRLPEGAREYDKANVHESQRALEEKA